MTKNIVAGGCSFTYGHELSDCNREKSPASKLTWSSILAKDIGADYHCTAGAGIGNSAIARRVFEFVTSYDTHAVIVMWTFPSRYDWAMPRHNNLEKGRWAPITPWDTSTEQNKVLTTLKDNDAQKQIWLKRMERLKDTGVVEFADSLYRHAANQYHEVYLSWQSIIWLQNILEKKNIPYFFTLASNTLFYDEFKPYFQTDTLLNSMYKEINFTNWFWFGERMMGFDQWALLNKYDRGTTHPLDSAHQDAVKLMKTKFLQTIKNQGE